MFLCGSLDSERVASAEVPLYNGDHWEKILLALLVNVEVPLILNVNEIAPLHW